MPLTRYTLHRRLAWVAALLAVAGLTGTAFSQGYRRDPVEALRAALKTPVLESFPEEKDSAAKLRIALDSRRNLLAKLIDNLRSVGDFRRALVLDAWEGGRRTGKWRSTLKRGAIAARLQRTLRGGMDSDDPTARMAAVIAIGEMGTTIPVSESASDDIERSEKPSGATNARKVQAGFARIFTPDLVKLLNDPNLRVAAAAARALSDINPDPREATKALLKLFESKDVTLRRAAAAALGNLVRRVTASISTKGSSITGLKTSAADVVQVGAAVAPAAGKCLSDSDAEVRRLSADALHQAAAALGDLLPSQEGRATAGEIPSSQRLEREPLDELETTNTQPLVRALGAQGPAPARALEDSDPGVRFLVRRTLEDMAIDRLRLLQRPSAPPGPPPGGERGKLPGGPVDEKEPPLLIGGEESEPPEVSRDPLLKGLRPRLAGTGCRTQGSRCAHPPGFSGRVGRNGTRCRTCRVGSLGSHA